MLEIFKRKMADFSQLGVSADWHCHLLPAVDDGVRKISDSEQILRNMKAAGITTVVHTPHINPEIFPANTEESICDAFNRYLDTLPDDCREGMDLRLAGEYMVVNGFENRKMTDLLQIEPGKALIEMSYMYPSATMEQTIFNIGMSGLTPVIAHPERYLYYADNLEQFERFSDMGAEFQLNLLSLGGCYGPGSVRIMEFLLNRGLYRYVGTDTHTPSHFLNISRIAFPEKYIVSLKAIPGLHLRDKEKTI